MSRLQQAKVGLRHTLRGDYPLDIQRPDDDGDSPYPLDWRRNADEYRQVGAHPTALAFRALADHAEYWHGRRNDSKVRFLAGAEMLRTLQDARGGWIFRVPVKRYRVPAGWYSGMAQGLAMSTFSRAYRISSKGEYKTALQAAANHMVTPTSSGGCADYDDDGRPFFEECPSQPRSGILNGAMFALIGLLDAPESASPQLSTLALSRLLETLPEYELGYWSRYDLWYRSPASYAYHSLHVSQLACLAAMTRMEELMQVSRRWNTWRRARRGRIRAAVGKAVFAITHRR